MYDVRDLVLPFRHLTGESRNICRLCLDAVDTGISLDDSCLIECFYYDDSVTYAEMLTDLQVPSDPTLPQLLCKFCGDLAKKAFFFQKLSQYSDKKWHEAIDRLSQCLDLEDTICASTKSAYIHMQSESNHIVTNSKNANGSTKEVAKQITKKNKNRRKYERNSKHKFIICSQCGEKVSYGRMTLHLERKHAKDYPCPHCSKLFRPICLPDHIERMHASKNLQCPMCDKKFSTQKLLHRHNLYSHTPVTCQTCLEVLPSRTALHLHSSKHKVHQCLRCSKIIKSRNSLLRHYRICGVDSDIINFICDICNKGLKNKVALKRHLTSHGFGKVFTCELCTKCYSSNYALKEHMLSHTQEKNFSCEQCGDLFLSKKGLKSHMPLHTGEKPYSCDVCSEKFMTSSRRTDHMRSKHLERRHVCSVCDRKFISKFCLSKHFARHSNPQSSLYVPKIKNKV